MITEHLVEGQYPVQLLKDGRKKFRVVYGAHVKGSLDWMEAAHEFGKCVFHQLECASLISR